MSFLTLTAISTLKLELNLSLFQVATIVKILEFVACSGLDQPKIS